MNKKQEDFRSMGITVQTVCANNQSVWNGDTVFTANYNGLVGLIGELETERLIQEQVQTGIALDKSKVKSEMITTVLQCIFALKGYAADNSNNELYERVNYSETELQQSRDTMLADRCKVVRDEANGNLANLGNYGIDANKMAALNLKIAGYEAMIAKPRAAKTSSKQATAQIEAIVKRIREHLKKKLDNNAGKYKGNDFFELYMNARIIINTAGHTTGIKGTVKDKQTGAAISSATVKNMEKDSTRKTNKEGRYSFKKEEAGIYTLEVKKKGYQTKQIPNVTIEQGKMNDLDIELEKG